MEGVEIAPKGAGPKGAEPKGAVFFDLDDTLLDVNSGWLWLQHEWALGRISASQILHAVFCLVLYALGYVENLDAALETAVSYYANTDAGELRSQTEAWFAQSVFPRTRPRALLAVAEHKASGERVVLASSTTQFAAECARVAYGLDDAVFTSLEVKEGRLTGRIASLAFGRQKAARVREWASTNGYSVSRCGGLCSSLTLPYSHSPHSCARAPSTPTPLRTASCCRRWGAPCASTRTGGCASSPRSEAGEWLIGARVQPFQAGASSDERLCK